MKTNIKTWTQTETQEQSFLLFLNMVGHYFDNIWIYVNSITDLNLANNNLEEGISKDLVSQTLLRQEQVVFVMIIIIIIIYSQNCNKMIMTQQIDTRIINKLITVQIIIKYNNNNNYNK